MRKFIQVIRWMRTNQRLWCLNTPPHHRGRRDWDVLQANGFDVFRQGGARKHHRWLYLLASPIIPSSLIMHHQVEVVSPTMMAGQRPFSREPSRSFPIQESSTSLPNHLRNRSIPRRIAHPSITISKTRMSLGTIVYRCLQHQPSSPRSHNPVDHPRSLLNYPPSE